MAKYGNIMTVYNCTPEQVVRVKGIFSANGLKFANRENSFFVETLSKVNTGNLIDEIAKLNIEYLFFHNGISDGSKVKSNVDDPQFLDGVNQIMFLP